jgi:hypothetical protein
MHKNMMVDCGCEEVANRLEGRALKILLAINATMFVTAAMSNAMGKSEPVMPAIGPVRAKMPAPIITPVPSQA